MDIGCTTSGRGGARPRSPAYKNRSEVQPLDSVRSQKPTEQLANPFRPGNGVAPPYLAGRNALLGEFDRFLAEGHPPHLNWTLTGIRGTGKTVLLGEFASRGERTGWLCLERELGERHRDEDNLVDAVRSDCESLIRRCDALAGVGQAVERGLRFLRPRRVTVATIGVEPSYEVDPREPAEALGDALAELDRAVAGTDRPGALLLYDEGHLLADDRRREQFPLSSCSPHSAACSVRRLAFGSSCVGCRRSR